MRPFFRTIVSMQGVNHIKAKEKQRKEIRAAGDISVFSAVARVI